jgi:Domain of unknown function (DUF1851)
VELTKTFAANEFVRALESWAWLDLSSTAPVFTSLFGDVFLRADDGWWYLDTIEGTLSRRWATQEELAAELVTDEGQDQYLLGGLALEARQRGIDLQPQQVYDFRLPPVLGGAFDVENIVAVDFVVAVNIAGQLHDQVRDLPPGTSISEIKFEQP